MTNVRVVSSDPSYESGRTNDLTMTPAGRLKVDATGASSAPGAASSTTTSVPSSATVVPILASNAARKGATVHNDSSAVLTLKLGSGASASSYTTKLAAGAYYEVPFGYTGIITGLWASANGNAVVTELA